MHLERKNKSYDSCWRQILTICYRVKTKEKISISENVGYVRLSQHNLWFITNLYLFIQMTKIYFLYIFGLNPWFLAHSSSNSWNFLSDKSNENIFCHSIWSLVFSSWNFFRAIKVEFVPCYSAGLAWNFYPLSP